MDRIKIRERFAVPVVLPEKPNGKNADPPDGRNSLFAESGTTPFVNAPLHYANTSAFPKQVASEVDYFLS